MLAFCFVVAIGLFAIKAIDLKKKFLQKLIIQKMVNKTLFSTVVAEEFAEYLLKAPKKEKEYLLKALRKEKIETAIVKIKNKKIRDLLNLILLEKEEKKQSNSDFYDLIKAFRALQKHQEEKASTILATQKQSKDKRVTALQHLLTAELALSAGDLQTVADETSFCLKIFKKKNMFFEEARAYFVLGTAYRISGIYDTADFMLRSALSLYKELNCIEKTAETYGTLGMLMAVQERFEEADSFYQKALDILKKSDSQETKSFITSQQALTALYNKKYKTAENLAQKSLKMNSSAAARAFAAEVLAYVFSATKKWEKQIEFSSLAESLYLKEKNYGAFFESKYLNAEALVNKGDLTVAEKKLRDLIQNEKKHKTSFHVANAITLLGVVLLRKKDIKGAKAVFNQALEQELYNERDVGIAIDYLNLAAVAKKCGNNADMRKNLENALIYAKDIDDDLCKKIKTALG